MLEHAHAEHRAAGVHRHEDLDVAAVAAPDALEHDAGHPPVLPGEMNFDLDARIVDFDHVVEQIVVGETLRQHLGQRGLHVEGLGGGDVRLGGGVGESQRRAGDEGHHAEQRRLVGQFFANGFEARVHFATSSAAPSRRRPRMRGRQ